MSANFVVSLACMANKGQLLFTLYRKLPHSHSLIVRFNNQVFKMVLVGHSWKSLSFCQNKKCYCFGVYHGILIPQNWRLWKSWPVEIGTVLSRTQQNGHDFCVARAIFSLTPVEVQYSRTDKVTLAVVWGCERFYRYLVGTQFDLITDQKPLKMISSTKVKSKYPLQMELRLLRSQLT